jgi:hypothetical protein
MSQMNEPDGASKGALLQNNLYGWIAEGTGRMDISSDPDVTFSYAAIEEKAKSKIVNPLSHIQFGCSLTAIRDLYTKDGVRYLSQNYADRASSGVVAVCPVPNGVGSTLSTFNTYHGNDASSSLPFLRKPIIDQFSLVPHIVADLSDSDACLNRVAGGDISYNKFAYINCDCSAGAAVAPATGLAALNNQSTLFQVFDLSNGEDGSFNVVGAVKLFAKYNFSGGSTDVVWPQGTADELNNSEEYKIDGIPITTHQRTQKDISFNFVLGTGEVEDCSYIAKVLYGDFETLAFSGGIMTNADDTRWFCTDLSNMYVTTAGTATRGLDISFTSFTLDAPTEINTDDTWMGDVVLRISGHPGDAPDASGGLKCIHVPDSLKHLRRDAATSLAANFAGITELLGGITIDTNTIPDISAHEINLLADNDISGGMDLSDNGANNPFNNRPDALNDVNGVFTISGDILSNRLMNLMKGSVNGSDTRLEHIHKIVYSTSGGSAGSYPDMSLACAARDTDRRSTYDISLVDDVNGTGTTYAGVSCEIVELTPQESAFFYFYPWASAHLCATNASAVHGGAGYDSTGGFNGETNPWRLYQNSYIDGKLYTHPLDLVSIQSVVPTAMGWMDNSQGFYNTAEDRTEWYSFVDICYNNNYNAIQTSDVSYLYQDIPTSASHADVSGAFYLSPLDIAFPDVSALNYNVAVNGALADTNNANNDFCTLNFKIPLKASSDPVQRRFDKVSNLNGGVIQLTNESYSINSGFTAKCHASSTTLNVIPGNIPELMNVYMPVIIRLMDSTAM